MDLYQTLAISPGATDDEIRTAYRRLEKQYHPDKNSSDQAHARVRMIKCSIRDFD